MSWLPTEVVDLVIDEALSSDWSSALVACSLVSRQWVPRTRHHGFSSIHLVHSAEIDSITTFVPVLESPLATFASSVQQLRISVATQDGAESLPARHLLSLLARHGVAPTYLELRCGLHDLVGAVPLPSVTHLHLDMGCYGKMAPEEFVAMTEFIHGLAGLTSLTLHSPDAPGSIKSTYPPPKLRELEIRVPRVLDTILSMYDTPLVLPCLIIRSMRQSQWKDVLEYLDHASALDSLALLYCAPMTVLQLYPTLRHLTIGVPFRIMPSHILTALGSSSATQLETLTLNGTREQPWPGSLWSQWVEVDAVLADSVRLAQLRWIILCGGGRDYETIDTSLRDLRDHLPLCAAQGLLVLQYTSTPFPLPGWV
ncbi:hypothetical protein FB45DRAFT_445771 [Roridomyces roridus]|uniref:F-box domain-containing protein n=1 Tax=Roridomyces roridus TaxID=1738132 RepID=A0AAD7FS54_9AGAR|nr:hypothetical protein FB45DRAFT_445771 [Roridomyces roridus]